MPIVRRNNGRGYSYKDSETGNKYPGVTTIIREGVPKEAIAQWGINVTVDYAIDHWERLSELPISVRMKELKGARWANQSKTTARGTTIHRLAVRLLDGERVAVPADLAGYVAAYVAFLDDFDVDPVMVETTVVDHTHVICGALDLVADLLDPAAVIDDPDAPKVRWLIDVKTAEVDKGVFGDQILQLAGYRFAEAWVNADGEEFDMPEIARCGVLQVRPDGYDLKPVDIDETHHRAFLYAQQMGEFLSTCRECVGEPIVPPRTSVFRLVRDE